MPALNSPGLGLRRLGQRRLALPGPAFPRIDGMGGGCSARLARTAAAAAAAALSLYDHPPRRHSHPLHLASSPSSARRDLRNRPRSHVYCTSLLLHRGISRHHTQARISTLCTRNIRPRLHLGAYRIRCPFINRHRHRDARYCTVAVVALNNAVLPASGIPLIPDPHLSKLAAGNLPRRYSQSVSQSASPLLKSSAARATHNLLQKCRALRTTPCSDSTSNTTDATIPPNSCIRHTSKSRSPTISESHCNSSSSSRFNRTHKCRTRLPRVITTFSRSNPLLSIQPPPPCSPRSPPLLPHPPLPTRLRWRRPPCLFPPVSRSQWTTRCSATSSCRQDQSSYGLPKQRAPTSTPLRTHRRGLHRWPKPR